MVRSLLVLTVGLALAGSQPALAQVFDIGSLTATLSTDHVTRSERQRARSGDALERSVGKRLDLRPVSSADRARSNGPAAARLTYSPSQERRLANYRRFIERSREADPSGAGGLEQLLRNDPVSQMDGELKKYGLRTTDVADAYAVYWTEAWLAAQGRSEEGTRARAQAVRAQAASALLATPEFAQASDAQKQEFAEALLVQALLISVAKHQSQGNPDQLRAIGTAVRNGALATGIDLDSMILTEAGFVARGG